MNDLAKLFTDAVYDQIAAKEGYHVAQCIEYLIYSDTIILDEETKKKRYMRVKEVANEMGMSEAALVRMRLRWINDGTLERSRALFWGLKLEAIKIAVGRVFDHWPAIIERIMDIALHDRNPRNVLAAADWLQNHIISGNSITNESTGSEEAEFLKRRREVEVTADAIIGRIAPPAND